MKLKNPFPLPQPTHESAGLRNERFVDEQHLSAAKRDSMKLVFRIGLALLSIGLVANADAASGWTNSGTIASIEQDPANYGSVSNQMFVVVNVTGNPSGC